MDGKEKRNLPSTLIKQTEKLTDNFNLHKTVIKQTEKETDTLNLHKTAVEQTERETKDYTATSTIDQTNELLDKKINQEIAELLERKSPIKRSTDDKDFFDQTDITMTSQRLNFQYFSNPKIKFEKKNTLKMYGENGFSIPEGKFDIPRTSSQGFEDSLNQKLKPDISMTPLGFHPNHFRTQPEKRIEQKRSQIKHLLFDR